MSRRNLLPGLLLVLGLARVATYARYVDQPYRTANDFSPDYVSAKEWLAGADPYAPLGGLYDKHFGPGNTRLVVEADQLNPHPPILIVLASPLARLDIGTARALILALALLAVFLAVLLFGRELGFGWPAALGVAAIVMALPLVEYEVRWAQTNGIILLALALGWRWLRRGSERGAGIALGFAAAIKIYPALMIVPLLRQRRFGAAAWMAGSAAAFTTIGVVALGGSAAVTFVTEASSRNVEAWGAAPNGISLVSLPFRLFASGRWLHPGVPVAAWISAAGLVILVLCVAAAWRSRAAASGHGFWAVVPWMVLASPIAWPHYLVTAIPIGILACLAAWRLPTPSRVAAVTAVAVLGLASPFSEWFPRAGYGATVVVSSAVMSSLLLLGVLDLSSRTPVSDARTTAPSLS